MRIDRRRKLPATTFLYALGMDGDEILQTFYEVIPFEKRPGGWATPYKPERWRGVKPDFPLIDADTGEEIAPAGTKVSARNAKRFADNGLKTLLLAPEALVGRYLARDASVAALSRASSSVVAGSFRRRSTRTKRLSLASNSKSSQEPR